MPLASDVEPLTDDLLFSIHWDADPVMFSVPPMSAFTVTFVLLVNVVAPGEVIDVKLPPVSVNVAPAVVLTTFSNDVQLMPLALPALGPFSVQFALAPVIVSDAALPLTVVMPEMDRVTPVPVPARLNVTGPVRLV